MNAYKKPVFFIMGPTATGKTDAAAALYDRFPVSIISVDSSLVYRGMNIGTAKPDESFLARYPHHLVNVRDPMQTYSVAEFQSEALELIRVAHEQDRVPVLVGGTFFYFNALEQGLDKLPSAQESLRQTITNEAAELGWPALHDRLAQLDPESALRIQPNDAQRIQRALEVVITTGRPIDRRKQRISPLKDCQVIKLGLGFSDRLQLHKRIELRYQLMLDGGLVNEVEGLLAAGVSAETTAMRMIGYRQTLEFLKGDTSFAEAKLKGIAATRQLAKRQLTWMRNQSNLIWWVDTGLREKNFSKFGDLCEQYLR